MRATYELRPRSAGEVLDLAASLLAADFGVYVGICALVWLPFHVGGQLIVRSGLGEEGPVWGLGAVFLQQLTVGFIHCRAGGVLLERRASIPGALGVAAARLVGLVAIFAITMICGLAGFCLCLFPSLLVFWLFGATVPAYVIERDSTFGREARARRMGSRGLLSDWAGRVLDLFVAVGRSVRLMSGWPTFLRWLGVALVTWPLMIVLNAVSESAREPYYRDALARWLPEHFMAYEILALLLGALFLGLASVVRALATTAFYVDARVRHEGLDLEVALARLQAARPASAEERP